MSRGRGKSQEKRQLIVKAASELFVEQGYSNTSMDTIAREAGVSKQTLYSHFGGKEQLFTAAIDSKCDEYQLDSTHRQDIPDCRHYLEDFAIHFARLLVSEEAIGIYRVCASEAGRSNVGKLFWEAGPAKIRSGLIDYLQSQVEAGVLHIEDTELAATQLTAMLHSKYHSRALYGVDESVTQEDLQYYARSCVDLFLRGYQATSPG
ncbi:TetR/AcrR family transcriptional regulator [Spongiibacter nanhainus]|uniref:TetR/AcrR family transcriptional regulator n=1 Tax=Spongiibacter nanhainus TaxID=2794344 RepID=A0A7T4QXX2_9GAMM|nr:TetR/AcrR family transcriptional regulator [Spongiibacter nanhainus]QQD16754.1 TetR/AcrR family transcriptional regulator [Spongiibacter nanhainus]